MKVEQSLIKVTADNLLSYIRKNQFKIGDRLPNEATLAQTFDVSRSTLREAVRMLVSRNILEVRQGSGTYISPKQGITDDPLGFSLVDDVLKLTDDLFELRHILEPKIAAKAAMNATDEDIKVIKKLCREIEKAVDDPGTTHFELDIKFHSMIARASNNIAMTHIVPVINKSIWLYNDHYTSKVSKENMIILHREIVDAIAQGDAIAAEEAMSYHIATIRHGLKNDQTIKLIEGSSDE